MTVCDGEGSGSRCRDGEPGESLASVVEELCRACNGGELAVLRGPGRQALPSRDVVVEAVEALRSVLFPGYFGVTELSRESMGFHVGATLDRVRQSLHEQVRRGLCFACEDDATIDCATCERRALDITREFLGRLPRVQRLLSTDVRAAYEGDPAAHSPDEAVFCYPGVQAITYFRLAHELHDLDVPLIPRIITEHAHSVTGIDIHPGATVGESFFIDHGTGVVVGETCEIGDRVRIYQGVTLGAKSFPLDEHGRPVKAVPRHPRVEDDVIIYSGATILGRVTIGRGAVIGGNVWLSRDVPPGARVTQAHVHEDRWDDGAGI
jgi:serine O-acetyltransferase